MSRRIECYICGLKDKLHPLPSNPQLAEKWKSSIPNATSDIFDITFRLCVNHFDQKFIFRDRHLLNWAYPELFYYNGKNWARDRSQAGEDLFDDDVRSSTSSPLLEPVEEAKSRTQQNEESPVILPLPPRRDDEPESDPLAIPDPPIIKTPVISHVASLHNQKADQPYRNTPQRMQTENRTGYNTPTLVRLNPKQHTSIESTITTRSASRTAARTPTQVLPTNASTPSTYKSRFSPNVVSEPTPVVQQNSGQQILLTQSANQQFIIRATNAEGQPIMLANPTSGQPIFLPDQNLILAPVNANQSQGSILLITNPGTLQPSITPPNSKSPRTPQQPSQRSSGPLFQPTPNGQLQAGQDQAQFKIVNESIARPEEQLRSVVEAMPRLKAKRTCDLNAEDAEYAEKLAQETIAAIKTDIARSQQNSRAIQKKINLLKLKVSTYESFISKLVSRRIISRQSAKECRVLQQDVIRYNRRKHGSGSSGATNSSHQDDSIHNNKENSNDTVDSFDSSTAKDHDYI